MDETYFTLTGNGKGHYLLNKCNLKNGILISVIVYKDLMEEIFQQRIENLGEC